MMMPVTNTTANGYLCQGRSDDAMQLINEWQAWAGNAPPGSREYRDIAMQRLRYCLDREATDLNLADLGLSELPEHLPPFLEELNVNRNKLFNLPKNLPRSLMILNASANQLVCLPDNLPPNLRELTVRSNELVFLPDDLPDSLKSLAVSNNQLVCLPDHLPASLMELYINRNRLICLPDNLPDSLIILKASGNRLTYLPNNLPALLKLLNVSYNQLIFLPERLPASLKTLNLHNNDLIYLPDDLPDGLRILTIRGNRLHYLPNNLPYSLVSVDVNDILVGSRFCAQLDFLEKIRRWSNTIDTVQWSAIQLEENAEIFVDFLQKLHQGKNSHNEALKGRVAEWLAYLAAEENRELRKQLFLVAQEAATSCVDRAAFYFNQMYILMIEDRLIKKGAPAEEVFNINVGIFRLQVLERYAAAQAERRRVEAEGFAEDIEIYLAYQCLLKARLSLPIYSELQYEEVAKLTEQELNAAVEWVTAQESTGFLRYLLTESTSWSGVLEKWDSGKKAKTDSDYLDALSSPEFERAVDKQLKEKALPVEDSDARRAVSSALARELLFEKRYQLTREYLIASQLLSVLDRFNVQHSTQPLKNNNMSF